ncbi:MAG: hypothetical protein EOM62_14475 [Bacteroidia bacterium]|nr:hypothetical protein [Bacteroidia bacterium]
MDDFRFDHVEKHESELMGGIRVRKGRTRPEHRSSLRALLQQRPDRHGADSRTVFTIPFVEGTERRSSSDRSGHDDRLRLTPHDSHPNSRPFYNEAFGDFTLAKTSLSAVSGRRVFLKIVELMDALNANARAKYSFLP